MYMGQRIDVSMTSSGMKHSEQSGYCESDFMSK